MKIGKVTLPNLVIQAPLAGVSDKAFRIISRSLGCGLTFTEMISDKGLIYGQKRTIKMVAISPEMRPLAVQIFGSEADSLAKAAAIVTDLGADIVDINMGCPAPKVVKNGEGAALMLDLKTSQEIMQAVVQATPVPVTVKMRQGWEPEDKTCLELADLAQQAGVKAITIHPRSRSQFFAGQADWQIIKVMKQRVDIPVIGNGDIWNAHDAARMLSETGCDAVMIGRASMGNPFIFRETVALLERGEVLPPPTIEERMAIAIKHMDLAIADKGETVAIREMRKHISWYIKGLRGAARIREDINCANTREEMLKCIQSLTAAN